MGTHMRVFSMMAKSSGLSLLQHMPQQSLRSRAKCSPCDWPSGFASRSKKVRIPLMSIMDMRVELLLSAITCGRQRSTYVFSNVRCGSEYRFTMPD